MLNYRKPYSLIKRNSVYHYRFYDENNNRTTRSTGQTTQAKAHQYVIELLKKGELLSARKEQQVDSKIKEKAVSFENFTEDFFVWGKCEYIIERNTLGGKSISQEHAYTERGYIENHIRTYFKKRLLKEISNKDIKNYIIGLKKKGKLSDGSINHILKIVKIIFSEAVRREILEKSPADGIPYIRAKQKDRGILTIKEVHKLFDDEKYPEIWGDEVAYTFNLFAVMTGCRRGEILGLQNKYVHEDHVEICHSWGRLSGLKPVKTKEDRIVPIHPGLSLYLKDIMQGGENGFTFSASKGLKAYPEGWILPNLYDALNKIGINKDQREERNITFHSFRHFFNTYCRANNITDDKVRAVTGHKTQAMVDNYTHFNIDDYKEVLDIQKNILN